MRVRQVVVALSAVCAVVAGIRPAPSPAAAGAGSPIRPENQPTPLAGQVNAALAPAQLIEVGPNCLAARAAAPSLSLLFTQANAAGISLGATICYRPLGDQLAQRGGACARGNCACAAVGGTSNHGWGKAVDLRTAAGAVTSFTSPEYAWLLANAGRYGWNRGAAQAPGAPCPEPWHWEWVGDGGTLGLAPVKADVVSLLPAGGAGYLTVTGLGTVTPHGAGQSRGGADQIPLHRLVVGAAPTPDGAGYWLVAADGGIFSFGTAQFHGSTGSLVLNRPIVGMAATPSGNGYWLVASDGGIFTFGDAQFFGSLGGTRRSSPVVGMASTPSGNGYWLASSDGTVTRFGDAPTLVASATGQPIVAIAATPSGRGYWLAGSEGAVYPAGDAATFGSITTALNQPVVGIRPALDGGGYWLVAADGGIFNFGDAGFLGAG